MSAGDDRQALKAAILRQADLRERVAREIRKHPVMALNGVMAIIAEFYADGASDGTAFGMRSLAAQVRADAPAVTGEDISDDA